MFLEDYCAACGEKIESGKIYHHISYDPEVVDTVDRSCHSKIHTDESFKPSLTPSMSREEAEAQGIISFEKPSESSNQHTVYYSDDEEELSDWVEKYEDVLGGRSDMYKRAVIILRKEHKDSIEELSEDTDVSGIIT